MDSLNGTINLLTKSKIMPKNYHKNDQKNKDQIKQMVFNRLDHMVKEASKIAKMFGRTGINFNAWDEFSML